MQNQEIQITLFLQAKTITSKPIRERTGANSINNNPCKLILYITNTIFFIKYKIFRCGERLLISSFSFQIIILFGACGCFGFSDKGNPEKAEAEERAK